jgi:hypothetical protein
MSWAASTTKIKVYEQQYYEFRTDPDDDEEIQRRKKATLVYEYRGLTLAAATSLVNGIPASFINAVVSASMAPIGGGGWTVTEERDVILQGWTRATGSAPED